MSIKGYLICRTLIWASALAWTPINGRPHGGQEGLK